MASIIEALFGKKKGATGAALATVADVQRALELLAKERAGAQRKIAESAEVRRGLLLVDGSDAKLDELERETDAARRLLERLDLAEPKLLDRLGELQGGARRALLAEFEGAYEIKAAALDKAMSALLEVFADYQGTLRQITAGGFEIEFARLCDRNALLEWRARGDA